MLNCSHSSRQTLGFSLVELLVAMLFVSLLMAGMVQVFAASLQGFRKADATIGAQRANRWALEMMQDDLQGLGFFFPLRPVPGNIDATTGQNALMILPANEIKIATPSSDGSGVVEEKIYPDELQYLSDEPLPVQVRIGNTAGLKADTLPVEVVSGNLEDVVAGDYVAILDPAYEIAMVASVDKAKSQVKLNMNASVQQDAAGNATGVSPGLMTLTHQKGANLLFVRPMQVVRYSVRAVAVDPGNKDVTLPCLVRQQAPYPAGGLLIDWKDVPFVRIAENVSGLRFDLSVDGGLQWARGSSTSWAAVKKTIGDRLAALNWKAPMSTKVDDPGNPLWYRQAQIMLSAELTTRTVIKMDLSAEAGVAKYGFRERRQTMIITPRNAALGL